MSAGSSARPSPRQRLRSLGVRPNRELGQNFLIDSNMLAVIADAAQLAPDDVVLEIGGGLGVLSEQLAQRAFHVHVVEVDAALEAPLREALSPYENVTLHIADVLGLDLAALTPAPTKVVANLPYGVAARALLATIEALPAVERWVVMVQREVGERLAAQPGGRDYGITSVLVQHACEVRVLRAVSRRVFHPVPNVDSVLVALRRRGPAAGSGLSVLVHDAFAHRRKALARSLSLAPAAPAGVREQARAVLQALDLPPDARAEQLSPRQFEALAQRLGTGGTG